MHTTIPGRQIETPEHTVQGSHTRRAGRVFKKSLGKYWVRGDNGVIVCSITNRLRKQLHYPEADPASLHQRVINVTDIRVLDPVAVGDIVEFVDSGDGTGQIRQVLPRHNKLARRAAGPKPLEQIIAANIDQIMVVVAASKPKFKLPLLDRYLLDAEAVEIPAVICLTKVDLLQGDRLLEQLKLYEHLGYPVYSTSAKEGIGIQEITNVLRNKITVLTGISGVGKSTLLNTIQPNLAIMVNEVSRTTGKGKHTTTHLEMHRLDCGGWVIDTPGMREFSLWKLEDMDIAMLFPEMRQLPGNCKFGVDCTHVHEPGCIIQEAVRTGQVTEHRYASYIKIYRETHAKRQKHLSKRKTRRLREQIAQQWEKAANEYQQYECL
jgi:ribosome biogenesis GTPase